MILISAEQLVKEYLTDSGPGIYDLRLKTDYRFEPGFQTGLTAITHEPGEFIPLEERCFGGAFHGKLESDSFELSWSARPLQVPYSAVLSIKKIKELPRATEKIQASRIL